jgi:hypothetical protein
VIPHHQPFRITYDTLSERNSTLLTADKILLCTRPIQKGTFCELLTKQAMRKKRIILCKKNTFFFVYNNFFSLLLLLTAHRRLLSD